MTYEPEHITRWSVETFNPSGWDGPENYVGETPTGFFCVVGRTRDSGDLGNSNFECVLRDLGGESETVKVMEFGHWACGWVQILGVHESDEERLRQADEIAADLADNFVWDEDDLSEREEASALDLWKTMLDLRERINLVKEAVWPDCPSVGMILGCRKDMPPDDENGEIMQRLTEWARS